MVQKEVADRLTAEVGSADYAAVTLAVKVFGDAAVTRIVDRHMFRPAPNVDSAVVRMDRVLGRLDGADEKLVRKLVRAAFAMRRKTLVNNLSASFGIPKQQATDLVTACGFPADVRGERLSLDDFIRLAGAMAPPLH